MSFKFDALVTILNRLDAGEAVSVHSLMNELDISERSVYRYISTLQQAYFPIIYDRRKESYAFNEGYSLRKLNLSLEETLAFGLAKNMLKNFGTGMEKGLNSIEKKISKQDSALPAHIILSSGTVSDESARYLGLIHQAITDYRKIELVYHGLHSDEESKRIVDPHYLFYQEEFWYLRAYCNESEDLRTFALDKIISLKVLDKHFLPKRINPNEELSSSFGSWIDGEPAEVILRFAPEVKAHLLRKKWHQSQTDKELKDGRFEVHFSVKGLGGIKKWIYQWIPYVEVVEPKELREEVLNELKTALNTIETSDK